MIKLIQVLVDEDALMQEAGVDTAVYDTRRSTLAFCMQLTGWLQTEFRRARQINVEIAPHGLVNPDGDRSLHDISVSVSRNIGESDGDILHQQVSAMPVITNWFHVVMTDQSYARYWLLPRSMPDAAIGMSVSADFNAEVVIESVITITSCTGLAHGPIGANHLGVLLNFVHVSALQPRGSISETFIKRGQTRPIEEIQTRVGRLRITMELFDNE